MVHQTAYHWSNGVIQYSQLHVRESPGGTENVGFSELCEENKQMEQRTRLRRFWMIVFLMAAWVHCVGGNPSFAGDVQKPKASSC